MKLCDREGKDGMNLLLEEEFYEIVRCEILKKKFKVDKEDIVRYYRDTDWERFYNEINKEVEK